MPFKTIDQQSLLALYRARQGFIKARTAQANQMRGLLAEFGLVIPQGINVRSRVHDLIEDASNDLSGAFRLLVDRLLGNLKGHFLKPPRPTPRETARSCP